MNRAEQKLPPPVRGAAEGDENGPFLVKNKSGDVLDRRNYCGWKAPEYGDGYSDSESDYDPKLKASAEEFAKRLAAENPIQPA